MKAAASEANVFTLGRYDAQNPQALNVWSPMARNCRPFSEAILDVCFKSANEVYVDISGKNEDFKKIWELMRASAVINTCGYSWRTTPTTPT